MKHLTYILFLLVPFEVFAAAWGTNWHEYYWRKDLPRTQIVAALEERYYGTDRTVDGWTNATTGYKPVDPGWFVRRQWWLDVDSALFLVDQDYVDPTYVTNGLIKAGTTNWPGLTRNRIFELIGVTNNYYSGQYYFSNYTTQGVLRWWGINRRLDYIERRDYLDQLYLNDTGLADGQGDCPYWYYSSWSTGYHGHRGISSITTNLSAGKTESQNLFSSNASIAVWSVGSPCGDSISTPAQAQGHQSIIAATDIGSSVTNYRAYQYLGMIIQGVDPKTRTNIPGAELTFYMQPEKPNGFMNWGGNILLSYAAEYDSPYFSWTENDFVSTYTQTWDGAGNGTNFIWNPFNNIPDKTNIMTWFAGAMTITTNNRNFNRGFEIRATGHIFDYSVTNGFKLLNP